ncbi:MAG: hypothetical protein Q8922_05925 [Bacteroidota bacterium]|nr:hypothetical protein [Bacteroidota bacterium]MDP4234088.1 hypothetical protein [Bacteroidota bacterium]MDP4243029.1 hypothetical protein [Bacteroidota bacterium]MDP4287455.1 hypothetical protein [Bacteroidota bacterium]
MPVLTRIGADGTKLWERLINLPDHRSRFNGLTQGIDGDVYAIGSDDNSIILLRCSVDGTIPLMSFIDMYVGAEGYDVKPCGNDLLAIGELQSEYVGRYRSDGSLVWKRLIRIDSSDANPSALSYQPKSDRMTIVGNLKSSGDLFVQALDTSGHTIRTKAIRLGNTFANQTYIVGLSAESVVNTSDSGLLIAGNADFYRLLDTISTDAAFCLKLDNNLNILWLHVYGGTASARAIELHHEYFLSASMDSFYVSSVWDSLMYRYPIKTVNQGPAILRIDSSGRLLESTLLSNGVTASYYQYYGNRPIALTRSGGFVITSDFNADTWLFQEDSLGHMDCGQTLYMVRDTSLMPVERDVEDSDLVLTAGASVIKSGYTADVLNYNYEITCPERSAVHQAELRSTPSISITERSLNIVSKYLIDRYEVFDALGRIYLQHDCVPELHVIIDAEQLPDGFYFLRFNSNVVPFYFLH